MSTSPGAFSLGSESGDDGSFRRQSSTFRAFVSDDRSADFPVAAGRYHLYVARACPWAHRTLIGRALMGLEDAISVSYADPIRDERGWRLNDDGQADAINGFGYLSEAYRATDPGYDARVTVPVLWDRRRGTIVNNESADILRMLSTAFARLGSHPVELVPERLRGEIEALNRLIYDNVNNAVYKAGFATSQRVWRAAAFCSAPSRWRPTGVCSRRSSGSTPSTRSTSSARSASSTSTSSCGRTPVTSTSGRGSPAPSTSVRSARTTTALTR